MSQFFGNTFRNSLLLMAGLYLLGFIGYYTDFSAIILLFVGIASAIFAYKKLDQALYLPFIELFSNPHGALVVVQLGGFTLSLRMVLFVGIMLGWGIGWLKKTYKPNLQDGRAQIFSLTMIGVFIGFILGIFSRNLGAVFSDGNAYLYLFYLLPILSVEWNTRHRHDFLQILTAGALWVSFVSFVLLYLYTHFSETILKMVYVFFRDLRIAEITPVGIGVYRIFIQSQVFTIIFGLILLCLAIVQKKRKIFIALGAIVVSIVLLALSRSFWVGFFPAFLFLLIVLWKKHKPTIGSLFRFASHSSLTVLLGVFLLVSIVFFPIPPQSLSSLSLVDSFKDRTTDSQDAGISSRWKLLTPMLNEIVSNPFLGHGFGKSVTFETDDPRVRAINPDGVWTTTSMEWGWFELWIKMGILGPVGFLYLGYQLAKRLWVYTSTPQAWLGYGLIAGLIFIFGTHFFSPYLNHPIGLGYLLFLIPFLSVEKKVLDSVVLSNEGLFLTNQVPHTIVVTQAQSRVD
ncbi:O-antigen ligase family protein [Candidatus Uhrbacteria bacterium]|nr:O-antigen ligase family protein [Candidatus Uhrbacteria bacterium]